MIYISVPWFLGWLATADNIHQAQFALDVKVKVLPLYEKIFDVPYPLPKLDTLVVCLSFGCLIFWYWHPHKASDFDAGMYWTRSTFSVHDFMLDHRRDGELGFNHGAYWCLSPRPEQPRSPGEEDRCRRTKPRSCSHVVRRIVANLTMGSLTLSVGLAISRRWSGGIISI